MISKIHHCMIDGAFGVDLANIQFSTSPEAAPLAAPAPYQPRPAPRRLELFLNEMQRSELKSDRSAMMSTRYRRRATNVFVCIPFLYATTIACFQYNPRHHSLAGEIP
jgi:hypothetical protein